VAKFSGYKNYKIFINKKKKKKLNASAPPQKTTTGLDIVFRMG
jgi:hypothetical protein